MEVIAYICDHIFKNTHPILLVSREEGDWQCLCGGVHHNEIPHVVGINHLFDRDPTLNELRDLPNGWEAERDAPNLQWRKHIIS